MKHIKGRGVLRHYICAIAAVAASLLVAGTARADMVVKDLESRAGVTERIKVGRPAVPVGIVVLIPGGEGILRLDAAGRPQNRNGSITVRSAPLFVEHGFVAAVVDAPSDQIAHPRDRGLADFRGTAAHAQDLGAVISWLRASFPNLPVWVVGTSQSSTSAANIAVQGKENTPDGIVLTSTGKQIFSAALDLGRIKVPTLIMRHEEDTCPRSTADVSQRIYDTLKAKGVRTELVTLSGGGPAHGDVCGATYYHGFVGLDAKFVDTIVAWIGAPAAADKVNSGRSGSGSAREMIFARFDVEHRGAITAKQFVEARHRMFMALDKDGNGEISRDEYIAGLPSTVPAPRREAFFQALDADHNGSLSATEIDQASRRFFHRLAHGQDNLTAAEFTGFAGPPFLLTLGVPPTMGGSRGATGESSGAAGGNAGPGQTKGRPESSSGGRR